MSWSTEFKKKKYWDFDSKEMKYIIRKIVCPTNVSLNYSENVDQDRSVYLEILKRVIAFVHDMGNLLFTETVFNDSALKGQNWAKWSAPTFSLHQGRHRRTQGDKVFCQYRET